MRRLAWLLILLILSVGVALLARYDSGYVLLAWQNWTAETSLSLFAILMLLLFLAISGGLHFLRWFLRSPGRMRHWRGHRRVERAHRLSRRGQIALAEGRWSEAEKFLAKAGVEGDRPLVDFLGAARAADRQRHFALRDNYLARAHASVPGADLAVGLTQAELQLSSGQHELALATLMRLRRLAPRHNQVLLLLMRLYEEMSAWGDLRDILPALRRQKAQGKEALDRLERRIHHSLLEIAANSGLEQPLRSVWEGLPRPLRKDKDILLIYTTALGRIGLGAEAEPLIRKSLAKEWCPGLIHAYGLVEGADLARQLAFAEGLLPKHRQQPLLLLSLGRLCLKNRLWGKAREYLEASISNGPRAETYRELGALLEQLDESEAAFGCYRTASNMLLDAMACTPISMTSEECEACKQAWSKD